MKTEFTCSKDNSATAAVMIAIAVAVGTSLFAPKPAAAHQPAGLAMQKMDTIVITGKQSADATLAPMIVTSSRVHKTQI